MAVSSTSTERRSTLLLPVRNCVAVSGEPAAGGGAGTGASASFLRRKNIRRSLQAGARPSKNACGIHRPQVKMTFHPPRARGTGMHISVEPREDYAILHLRGEFDTYYVPALQQEIDQLAKSGIHKAVLNLRLVRFINSTALGAVIKSSKQLSQKGGKLVISRPSTFCRDIFEKVGLDRVVPVFDSDESATEALKSGGPGKSQASDDAQDNPSSVLFAPV